MGCCEQRKGQEARLACWLWLLSLGMSKLESKGCSEAGLACVFAHMRVYLLVYTAIGPATPSAWCPFSRLFSALTVVFT